MDLTFNLKLFSFTRTVTITRRWLQYLIIAAVLLVSAVVSFWGGLTLYILVVALLVAIAGLIVLLQQPNLGFILIFLGGMFVPFVGPSGLNAATVMVAVMLGLWILDMFVVKRDFIFIRSQIMTPIVIFLAISILSFAMGQVPWFVFARQAPITAQLGGFAIFVFSIGAMLLSAHLIKDLRWLQIIVWTFIALSAIYVVGRAIRSPLIDRVYTYGFSNGSMFWTWLVALAAGQVFFNDQLRPRLRNLLIVLIVLTFYVAMGQAYDWKSGWLPPMVALCVVIGNRHRKLVLFAIPFVIIGALYVALGLIASDDYSWGTRLDAWRIILEISRVSPLLGMGFSNYYWYTPLFPIRGWRVSFNSHSQFVDLIAQTGYIGLLCFLWLFFMVGRLSWNFANKLPSGFARGYSNGVFAGIIGTIIAAFLVDWVLPFVYNIGLTGFRASILPWIFMGGMIAIQQMELQKTKS
jgi:hypothetical protein